MLYPPGEDPVQSLYYTALPLLDAADNGSPRNLEPLPTHLGSVNRWALGEGATYSATSHNPVVGWGKRSAVGMAFRDALDRPVLAVGMRYPRSDGVWGQLLVTADGQFRLIHTPWGDRQRGPLATSSFLDWAYVASEIVWYVRTKHIHVYETEPLSLKYIPHRVMLHQWCRIVNNDIVPAMVNNMSSWEHAIKLRERRLRISTTPRDERGRLVRRRPAILRQGRETLTQQQATTAIAARLVLSAPAKTTPRRTRPIEALKEVRP